MSTISSCSSSGNAVEVSPPSLGAADVKICRSLYGALPDSLDGLRRRTVTPKSELTAAWGNPAVVLTCGIPRPEKMSDPNADAGTVEGVNWLMENSRDGSYRCTTTYRKVYVQVYLPEKRAHDVNTLMQLAKPIKKWVPSSL
ncbi:DUF3515 domain-containing protein [Streptomyces hokutonensis]|uniref:DUF3515 domain-containing protein n=1 Tax=Streptomyces hokutonensis TaxID=1306990 RepID=UPI0033EA11E7